MTVTEQFEIINAYHEGTPVYYTQKLNIDKYDWEEVKGDHCFNFERNVYHIGDPLTFEDALCESTPYLAFRQAIKYLTDTSVGFGLHVTDSNGMGQIIREYSVANLDSLYKLWNLAMNYGKNHTGELTPITEEEGKINN